MSLISYKIGLKTYFWAWSKIFQTFLKRPFLLRLKYMKITFFSNIIGMKWVKQPHRYHVQRNTCANGNKGSLIIYLNNCFLLAKKCTHVLFYGGFNSDRGCCQILQALPNCHFFNNPRSDVTFFSLIIAWSTWRITNQ